jgi:GntR family transcriptional regulator
MSNDARTPRYAEISETLRAEIAAGQHAVGSLLPTESSLCQRFGVSRYTVREALRRLQANGMVSRVQGAGSRVLCAAPAGVFVQNYRSMSDLTQYAEETELEVLGTRPTVLDADLAERIGGGAGDPWLNIRGVRRMADGEPVALVESYVPERFAAIAPELARGPGPIYAGLAQAAGEAVVDVQQETQALPAPEHVAWVLGIDTGAPTLRILRRYASLSGTLIASFNWHLGGDRYIHRTRIGLGGS